MRPSFVFFSGLVLASAGCSESQPDAGECASTKDCEPGYICRDGACEQICAGDSDCASGRICVADICEVGDRGDAPVIRAIDGNGTEDVAGGLHAAHHFADAVVLGGEYFTGSTVEMVDAASQATRLVVAGTDTELTAELPADLVAGDYTIRVVNAAGADQVTVSILQGERGPPGSADLIAATTTLNVGPNGDFADINAALDSLNGMVIPPDVTITIRVENGDYTYDAPVVIDHANGDRIHIVGNESNADAVGLTFNGCHGFYVDGARLGWLNGFRIVGDGTTAGRSGISLERGAVVRAGAALKTVSWGGSGVVAGHGSVFHGDAMVSADNGRYGFLAAARSSIQVNGSTSQNNQSHGYWSLNNSEIAAGDCTAANNGSYGYVASLGSYLLADRSTADSNAYGFSAQVGSTLVARSSQALDNARTGFWALRQSIIDASKLSDASGSVADGNGHTDSVGSGFVAGEGSTVYASESTATDNFSSGYVASTNATVRAVRGQALRNGGHGFLCDWGSACLAYDAVADGNGSTANHHGFAAFWNSTLHGQGAEARNYKGQGFRASNGSIIYAAGIGADNHTVACGNDGANFSPTIGNTDFAASNNASVIDAGGSNVDDIDGACP